LAPQHQHQGSLLASEEAQAEQTGSIATQLSVSSKNPHATCKGVAMLLTASPMTSMLLAFLLLAMVRARAPRSS